MASQHLDERAQHANSGIALFGICRSDRFLELVHYLVPRRRLFTICLISSGLTPSNWIRMRALCCCFEPQR